MMDKNWCKLASQLLLVGAFSALAGCTGDPIVGQSSSVKDLGSSSSSVNISSVNSSSLAIGSSSSASSGGNTGVVVTKTDAASVTMRRFSRAEYNNTVRDLLGITAETADSLPSDEGVFSGGDVDSLNIVLYYSALGAVADKVVESAVSGNRNVISCELDAPDCAKTVIDTFGLKAWRRPISAAESTRLLAFYDEAQASSSDAKVAMQTLIQRILLSPHFMYRPEPNLDLDAATARALNSYELASRLSYFLWASMPDDALFAKAAAGTLMQDEVLKAEVVRMLDDPKAQTLVDNFAAQWLGLNKIDNAFVDEQLFPDFNDALRVAFKSESKALITYLLKNNRPVADIVAADYTFLNGTLAQHYGVNGIDGDAFQRYSLESSGRRGLLGHASILTITGQDPGRAFYLTVTGQEPDAIRYSPTPRGYWVAKHLQCNNLLEAPHPPILQDESLVYPLYPTLNRWQIAETLGEVEDSCINCHNQFDPLGQALANFDDLGRWRDTFPNGDAIDAYGMLASGETIQGPADLPRFLSSGSTLATCAISHSLSYALGRTLDTLQPPTASAVIPAESSDAEDVAAIYQKTQGEGNRLRDIFAEIALSPAFRYRRADLPKTGESL